jgi:hypothetical protein
VAACVLHQLRRRIKAHGLRVEQAEQEGHRLVALQPGRDIDQQGEARRVRFGEAVLAETLDLAIQRPGEFVCITATFHAVEQSVTEEFEAAMARRS